MARIRETLFRFTGAVLLGVSATAIDNPQELDAPQASRRIDTVPVVVAAMDIPVGVVVDRAGIKVAQWIAGTAPAGAYTSLDSVANRVTRVAIYKGEAIVPGRLAPEGTGAGLEVSITPGKRAYGIRINDVAALPGLIRPNGRVDIMVVIHDPTQGKQVAKMFMSNMRVLAIGAAPERTQDGRPSSGAVASIEVTPEEAERLAIAASQGLLRLVLRGYGDPDSVSTARFTPSGSPCGPRNNGVVRDALLRSCESPPPPPVVVPRVRVRPDSFALKVFRGVTKAEALKFAKDSAARGGSARP